MRYLPHVVAATSLVAVVPVVAVWWLRAERVISSPYVGIAVAMGLSLAASFAASAYWQRRRGSGDLVFSELLLWGWLRRLRAERRLANAAEVLGLAEARGHRGDDGLGDEERVRALKQLAAAREAEDAYLDGHSRRVARHSAMIARGMGLPREAVAKIRAAADVHDVGKLYVPAEILNKPDRLTDAEFEVVKRHPEDGAEMVSGVRNPELTAIVRHHHERLDGGGYPSGLRGEEIPLGARIVAVADTFDAITSARAYRPAAPHKRALDILAAEAGTQLDPAAVRAFLRHYRGGGSAAVWAMVAVAPQHAFARARSRGGASSTTSLGQVVATTVATVAVGTLAATAPVGERTTPSQVSPFAPIASTPTPSTPIAVRSAARPHAPDPLATPARRHERTGRDLRRVPAATGPELRPGIDGDGSPRGQQDPAPGSGTVPGDRPTDGPAGAAPSRPADAVPTSPADAVPTSPSGTAPSTSPPAPAKRQRPPRWRGRSLPVRQDGSHPALDPGGGSPPVPAPGVVDPPASAEHGPPDSAGRARK